MGKVEKSLKNVIEKCDICINGNIISKEMLLQTLVHFLDETISKQAHNVGFVLHTGSSCYDVIMLTYAAVYNLLCSEYDPEDVVHSLLPGDLVLYYSGTKPQKYSFRGFVETIDSPISDDGNYIVLEQGPTERTWVPRKRWSRIVPYLGRSEKLGGVGLRKENGLRERFCTEILGMTTAEVPRTVDVSTVIVMTREHANELINGISFQFGETNICLTDLVPVSYYTEGEQVYQYGSNLAKVEPVLKLTGKMSVARKLLLRCSMNRTPGLIVLGEELIKRGESELPELLDRKSLQYAYVCTHIDSENAPILVQNYEHASVFACTKDFLLSNTAPIKVNNNYTRELEGQIAAIIDREVVSTLVDGFVSFDNYKAFKQALFFVKSADYDTDDKNDFIVQAFSLMNLYLTAPFSIATFDQAIKEDLVKNIASVERRIEYLRTASAEFPAYLQDSIKIIISILEDTFLAMYDQSPKAQALEKELRHCMGQRIAIIAPKAYYASIMKEYLFDSLYVDIVTPNRFDNTKMYDRIIVLGDISGSRFNIFRCKSASTIQVLLYEYERYHFEKTRRHVNDDDRLYNKRATVFEDYEEDEEVVDIHDDVAEELSGIDEEIEHYIDTSIIRMTRSMSGYGECSNVQADVSAIIRLDTGEFAFLSKNYKAYLLDPSTKSATEMKCTELNEGDTIVFTRSSTKTRDIVESLLEQLIDDKKVPKTVKDAYALSKRWKEVLIEYMNQSGKSAKVIAEAMIANGVTVQEITIRGWLDEDSHTVGPRKVDSIQQIALLAGDDDLFDHAELCFDACASIRRLRRRILDAIAQAILGSFSGTETEDAIVITAMEQVTDLATVAKIERITFVNEQIPVNMVNRPVMLKGKMEESYGEY